MNLFITMIHNYSRAIITLTIVCTLFFASFLPQLKIQDARRKFDLPPNDRVMQDFQKFESLFGSHQTIILGLEFDNTFGVDELETVERLTDHISKIEGVIAIHSIANGKKISWKSYKPILVPLYIKGQQDSLSISRLREFIRSQPIYNGNLLSVNGKHASIIIEMKGTPFGNVHSGKKKGNVLEHIKQIVQSQQSNSFRYHLAGIPLVEMAMEDNLKRDVTLFGSLSVILFLTMLIVIFKSFKSVIVVAGLAIMSLIWSIGVLSLTKTPLSLGLAIMIPLIPVISIAYSVHYVEYFVRQHNIFGGSAQRVSQMVSLILPPSILTASTTMIGFASLAMSRLEGIREVGVYLAIGVAICFFMNSVFLPAVLSNVSSLGAVPRNAKMSPAMVAKVLGDRIGKYSRVVIIGALIVAVFAIVGLSRLRVDTNQLYYFHERERVRQDYIFIDRNFGGSLPLEIIVSRPVGKMDGIVHKIDRLEKELRSLDGMGVVVSGIDFLKMADEQKPPGSPVIDLYFDFSREKFPKNVWKRLSEGDYSKSYLTTDGSEVTFRIASRAMIQGSHGLQKLLGTIHSLIGSQLPDENVLITGLVPIFVKGQNYIIGSQILSFSVAFVIVLVILSFLSRSLRLGIIAVTANVLPVLITLGIMGWRRIPLDMSTVMIASIAIGIAVDDTIHFLYKFLKEKNRAPTIRGAIQNTFNMVGSPLIITSIVCCAGFFVLVFSNFSPTRYFGFLSGITVITALLGDIILLPAMLNCFQGFYTSQGDS